MFDLRRKNQILKTHTRWTFVSKSKNKRNTVYILYMICICIYFPTTLTVSLRGQPSAICYLLSAKKNKTNNNNNALESLLPFPNPKVGLPFLGGFCFFFLGTHSLPKLNPKQSHPKKMCIILIFSGVGEGWSPVFLRLCGPSSCILWK